jgi:hypothetical protein
MQFILTSLPREPDAIRSTEGTRMRYTIYEDPLTHKFALLPLPTRWADGDKLPVPPTDRWFDNHDAAVAALPELFNREEPE